MSSGPRFPVIDNRRPRSTNRLHSPGSAWFISPARLQSSQSVSERSWFGFRRHRDYSKAQLFPDWVTDFGVRTWTRQNTETPYFIQGRNLVAWNLRHNHSGCRSLLVRPWLPDSGKFSSPDGSQPTHLDRFHYCESCSSIDRKRIQKHQPLWIIRPLFQSNYHHKLDSLASFLVWSRASWPIIALARGDPKAVHRGPMVVDCCHGGNATQESSPGPGLMPRTV